MKRTGSLVWGIVLLLAGVALTLQYTNVISITGNLVVPVILLALAVVFHLYYFLSRNNNEGLLVPGGILLTYGLMFLWAAISFDNSLSKLWPLFIIGPAVGLFELYVFSGGRQSSMIPVFILTAIGGAFLLRNLADLDFNIVLAVVLVCIGLGLMVSALFRNNRKQQYTSQSQTVQPEIKVEPPVEPVVEGKAEPVQEEPKQ